jgi:Helix-turn-helix domain
LGGGVPGKERKWSGAMVRVEMGKWKQTLEDLRQASLHTPHARTRERFQALYLIASGAYNATTCAAHIGRQDETVLAWVHRYNEHGPDALSYRRTGGRSPLLPPDRPNSSSRSWRRPIPAATACRGTTGR